MKHGWRDIEPGDFGWIPGYGPVGYLIRLFTKHPAGHSFVFVRKLPDGKWLTHDASPGGLREYRTRSASDPVYVARVWRNEAERRAILYHSESLIGTPYAYGEILRIMAARVLGWFKIRIGGWDGPRVICSNHVAQCALAARPELAGQMAYPHWQIWPGRLHQDLQRVAWNDLQVMMQDVHHRS